VTRRGAIPGDKVRLALAGRAFAADAIRLVDPDLEDFTHLVASRDGCWAATEGRFKPVLHGFFFGLTVTADAVFLFEASGRPHDPQSVGRLIRLKLDGRQLGSATVVARELDPGCHQIDVVDGALLVADTYRQRLLRYPTFDQPPEIIAPLAPARRGDWQGGYAHVNSLTKARNGYLLMLHNGGAKVGRDSELVRFDEGWNEVERVSLSATGAHDIAVLDDGEVLICASESGELISLDGRRLPITTLLTRGLSVGRSEIVVGVSEYALRDRREVARGRLYFLGRDFQIRSAIDLPAAPTAIRRIDGMDFTQSSVVGAFKARLR
jgi:hypothetical protein